MKTRKKNIHNDVFELENYQYSAD